MELPLFQFTVSCYKNNSLKKVFLFSKLIFQQLIACFSLLYSHLPSFPYPSSFYLLKSVYGLSALICSVSLQWCGRTHLTSLYCSFTLQTRMQCWFTKERLTRVDFFVIAFVFHVSKKICLDTFLTYKWRVREIFPWFFFFCVSEVANAEVILQEIFLWILTSLLCGF